MFWCTQAISVDDELVLIAMHHAGMNTYRVMEAFMAISAAGCILCPLNLRWSDREVQHAIKLTNPSILICDPSYESIQAAALATNPKIQILSITDDSPCFNSCPARDFQAPDCTGCPSAHVNRDPTALALDFPRIGKTVEELLQEHAGMFKQLHRHSAVLGPPDNPSALSMRRCINLYDACRGSPAADEASL
jgi:acyl-CoA synthetase (AMP-forming)/AMP-acid ligase II